LLQRGEQLRGGPVKRCRPLLILACALGVAHAVPPRFARADEGMGTLSIGTGCLAADVFVDDRQVAKDAVRVEAGAGVHRIRADYGGGDEEIRLVYVNPGVVLDVPIDPPRSRCFADLRHGLHYGVGLGIVPTIVTSRDTMALGPRFVFALNYGVAPAVDLRTGLQASFERRLFGDGDPVRSPVLVALDVPLHVRFNIGSVYTLGLGGDIGFVTDTTAKGFAAGPWINLLGFRMGSRGQWELDLGDFTALVYPEGPNLSVVMQWGFSLTYVFLPEPKAHPPP
jgi:hypothetical protein